MYKIQYDACSICKTSGIQEFPGSKQYDFLQGSCELASQISD